MFHQHLIASFTVIVEQFADRRWPGEERKKEGIKEKQFDGR